MAKKVKNIENPLLYSLDQMTTTALYIATMGSCPILRRIIPVSSNILDDVTEQTLHDESHVLRYLVARCAGAGKLDTFNECQDKEGNSVCPLNCRPRLININIEF